MRAVVQRVTRASVSVGDELVAAIEGGLLVLVGVSVDDEEHDADALARKIAGLRVFADANDAMNLALGDVGGAVLVVSQFTLLGDVRKGRRPSFVTAARGEDAERLYERVAARLREAGLPVQTGRFGAAMAVELVNDGPVTILVDTRPPQVQRGAQSADTLDALGK
jgi:D-tyrosyl-tRNA(Tyr) deacylase